MISLLNKKNFKEFWKEVDLIRNNDLKEVEYIDERRDPNLICEMFSEKYRSYLSNNTNKAVFNENSLSPRTNGHFRFSLNDINERIGQLKHSIGMDGIHSNHLKFCPESFRCLISVLFQVFLDMNKYQRT